MKNKHPEIIISSQILTAIENTENKKKIDADDKNRKISSKNLSQNMYY